MPIFGRYESVELISTGASASLYRAREVDGRNATFFVKVFQPKLDDPAELKRQIETFLNRVKLQEKTARAGQHWAPIRASGKVRDGAFYVTDQFPQSVQSLLAEMRPISARGLRQVIGGAVDGLRELAAFDRAHGNLKPENVLLSGPRPEDGPAILTDPADDERARAGGEAGDLLALGKILHLLAVHADPPRDLELVRDAPEWNRLGNVADGWRQLCIDLLTPQPSPTSGHLEELAGVIGRLGGAAPRVKKAKPIKPARSKTASPARKERPARPAGGAGIGRWLVRGLVAALVVVVAITGYGVVIQRELCRQKSQWLDAFVASAGEPARHQRYLADPQLARVVEEARYAADPSTPCGGNWQDYRPWQAMEFRQRLLAAEEISTDLSPEHWATAEQLHEAQQRLAGFSWAQPPGLIASRLTDLRGGAGTDLAAAIDEVQKLASVVQTQLPPLQQQLDQFFGRVHRLQGQTDPHLSAFGGLLGSGALQSARLTPGGFSGLQTLQQNNDLADQLLKRIDAGYPANVDIARFASEVTARLSLTHPTVDDVRTWIEKEPQYVRADEAVVRAVAELREKFAQVSKQVADTHPDSEEGQKIQREQQQIARSLDQLRDTHVIARDLADGSFIAQRSKLESQIAALLEHIHSNDAHGWLASLPTLSTRSDLINAYWEDWKHVLQNAAADMARRSDVFSAFKRQTQQLRATLTKLDSDLPAAPGDLPADFAAAARAHRERSIGKLLAELDPSNDKVALADQASAAEEYRAWTKQLSALASDFPLRHELVTLEESPDLAWSRDHSDFWNDPVVQELVRPDVERLGRLRHLRSLSRADLIDTATESKSGEVMFACWQLLGAASPAWPTLPGELDTEADLRKKLSAVVLGLKNEQQRGELSRKLADEGPVRWRRFVEQATSEAQLERAIALEESFGPAAALEPTLSAPARFDLALYRGRQRAAHLEDDQAVAELVAGLVHAARELPDSRPTARLLDRLARISVKEKLTDQATGARFTWTIPNAQPMVFQRVEPSDDRPFYLCTTEVSLGQLVGVVQAAGAWERLADFNWGLAPDQRDTRRGPRVWEWVRRPELRMRSTQSWLTPEDDNDFDPSLRIDRFNRMALSEDVGGNPSPDHPMQQIPADAALYFAGLCGFRLPTSAEWHSAYAIFERTVPVGRWNLRDQTWALQQQYLLQNGAPTHWPDDGCFRPDDASITIGAKATAFPQNDGTLYFRKVDGAGGGTFHHLIGNVAQFLCEAPDDFDRLPDKSSPAMIRDFLEHHPACMSVIGGSALSAPQMPLDSAIPLPRTDRAWADVGLRLAFTAPARSLAERLQWALAGQRYLWETPATTQASK